MRVDKVPEPLLGQVQAVQALAAALAACQEGGDRTGVLERERRARKREQDCAEALKSLAVHQPWLELGARLSEAAYQLGWAVEESSHFDVVPEPDLASMGRLLEQGFSFLFEAFKTFADMEPCSRELIKAKQAAGEAALIYRASRRQRLDRSRVVDALKAEEINRRLYRAAAELDEAADSLAQAMAAR